MSTIIDLSCPDCDAACDIKHNMDDVVYTPNFCPFCGFDMTDDDFDYEDYEDEDEEYDDIY